MHDREYQMPVVDVADLRQCLIDTHCNLQSIVDSAIDEWRKRFQVCCVNEKESQLNSLVVIFRLKCTPAVCTHWIFFLIFRLGKPRCHCAPDHLFCISEIDSHFISIRPV